MVCKNRPKMVDPLPQQVAGKQRPWDTALVKPYAMGDAMMKKMIPINREIHHFSELDNTLTVFPLDAVDGLAALAAAVPGGTYAGVVMVVPLRDKVAGVVGT